MSANLKKVFYYSFFMSVCVGFFMHIFYELSNYSRVVGLFTPINESLWEQLKRLFFPYLIFSIILYFFTKRNTKTILFGNFIALLVGICLFINISYTIHGAFGINHTLINMGIQIICTGATYFLCMYFFSHHTFSIRNTYGFLLFVLLFLVFTVFTFLPPRVPLFQDSHTKSFGLIHQKL